MAERENQPAVRYVPLEGADTLRLRAEAERHDVADVGV